MVSEIKARSTFSLIISFLNPQNISGKDLYLVVSLALMAVFRSVRKVAIKGGRTGPVEFHRTRRAGRREEKRKD